MADLLRRELAPLTPAAWDEVDDAAKDVLKSQLSARSIVDFSGPHGIEFGAVSLGRLEIAKKKGPAGAPWGLQQIQPLVEVRLSCTLDQLELDNVSRGSKDADLGPLEDTARQLALFEETAIYKGFGDGDIRGMIPAAEHKPLRIPANAEQMTQAVADGIRALMQAGVGGPYALVLGTSTYYPLMQAGKGGYPPKRIIRDLLDGPILWSPALDGGVLLSTRGGDFELVVGQDIAIGYAAHDRQSVELYLTESFTFRVLEPAAAIELRAGTAKR